MNKRVRSLRVAEYAVVTMREMKTDWKNAQHQPVYVTTYNVWENRDGQSNLIGTKIYEGLGRAPAAVAAYKDIITSETYRPF